MEYIDEDKIKKVRELEFELTKSHTQKMYEKPSHLVRKKAIEELIIKHKTRDWDGNILDYGCAEGLYCEFLLNNGFGNIYGVDISKLKIAEARNKYGLKGIKFFTVDEFNRVKDQDRR